MSTIRTVLSLALASTLIVASCRRSEPAASAASAAPAKKPVAPPATVSAPAPAPAPAPSEPDAAADPASRFPVASVRVAPAKPPARFAAGLPTTLAGFEDADARPPLSQFAGWVCRDEYGARAKLVAAVRAAAAAGTLSEELSDAYRGALRYCDDPSLCPWLIGLVRGDAPDAVKRVLWGGLVECGGDEALRTFDDPEAPLALLVEWYFRRFERTDLPVHPRLAAALAAQVRAENRFEARKAGVVPAHVEDAAAVRLVEAVQSKVEDPQRKALLAIGLWENEQPRARELYVAACAGLEDEPMCGRAAPGAAAERTLAERAMEWDFDPVAHVKTSPTDVETLVVLYGACARRTAGRTWDRARCLERLARVDRAAAVTAARSLTASQREIGVLARTLVAFPEPGALAARLVRWGLVPKTPAGARTVDATEPPLTVREMMRAHDRVHTFDTETGAFPNEHDELLARLASMAGAELAGVYFLEEAPDPDVVGYDGGSYTLHAYADGKRYTTVAGNHGDWYDVDVVVGLLNAVLKARGSALRYVTLATSDQMSHVAVGPAEGLLVAGEAGLLDHGAADAGARIGKDFEERVLEHLRREGKLE